MGTVCHSCLPTRGLLTVPHVTKVPANILMVKISLFTPKRQNGQKLANIVVKPPKDKRRCSLDRIIAKA